MLPTAPRLSLALGLASAAGLVAALAPRSAALPARAPQEPAVTRHQVAGRVSYLEIPMGGNVGLCATDDGLLVIDSHLERTRAAFVAAIAETPGAPARYLLNTHWHGDHTGNNAPLGEQRATILAQTNVRRRLTADPGIEGRTAEGTPAAALPTITYDEDLSLHLGGESISVLHYGPGHTDGDSVVFFHDSKVVHMGDLFFNGLFPFIDVGSGGDPEGYARSVEAVLDSVDDEWRLIPGHGPLATRADLERFHLMLVDCIERVRAALAEGQSVEEMQKEGLFADYDPEWGWQFISADKFIADLATVLGQGR